MAKKISTAAQRLRKAAFIFHFTGFVENMKVNSYAVTPRYVKKAMKETISLIETDLVELKERKRLTDRTLSKFAKSIWHLAGGAQGHYAAEPFVRNGMELVTKFRDLV